MPTNSKSASTSSRTTTTTRYWRRNDTPRPWWPVGLLPVLGLAVLFLFGALVTAPAIQAEVRQGVDQRLGSSGYVDSETSADGRQITVQLAGADADEVVVQALAASTTCDTWVGEMTCPSIVDVERDLVKASTAIATSRPHQFEVVRDSEAVILRGEVPSATEHQRIVNLAGGYFGQVKDEMRVSNESAGSNFTPAADRALAVVSRLDSGQANWSGEQLSVSGAASSDAVVAARADFDTAEASGFLGRFDVQSLEQTGNARQNCNETLNDVLSKETIRFQTGSATIDTGNEKLLERLATLAGNCPGNLTVEGHTDSRGDADMNKALSLARAAAVRDALVELGIETTRMNAVGYGDAKPIADNESAAGRASNRRIAISVDEFE